MAVDVEVSSVDVEPHSSTPPNRSVRVILRARPEDLEQCARWATQELLNMHRYDRIGWGWSFGHSPSFFVRRIKDGLSCTARYRDGDAKLSSTADAGEPNDIHQKDIAPAPEEET